MKFQKSDDRFGGSERAKNCHGYSCEECAYVCMFDSCHSVVVSIEMDGIKWAKGRGLSKPVLLSQQHKQTWPAKTPLAVP